jgi:hypothetical protein
VPVELISRECAPCRRYVVDFHLDVQAAEIDFAERLIQVCGATCGAHEEAGTVFGLGRAREHCADKRRDSDQSHRQRPPGTAGS